eukprot:8518871-Alexandrium_andersonii.AAC.1
MSGGAPEGPPGLDPINHLPKRSRSAGPTPSSSSAPTALTPTAAPTTFGPSGVVGVDRRAPGAPEQPPASSGAARVAERASGVPGWQGGLAEALSRSASASAA